MPSHPSLEGKPTLPLDQIKPYENNPRRIPQRAVDEVAGSMDQFGQVQPIVLDAENVIIIGHVRLRACQKLGWEEAWVEVADKLTPKQVAALRVVDNRTGEIALWDMMPLAAELDSLLEGASEQVPPGFDSEEVAALLALLDTDGAGDPNAAAEAAGRYNPPSSHHDPEAASVSEPPPTTPRAGTGMDDADTVQRTTALVFHVPSEHAAEIKGRVDTLLAEYEPAGA